MALKMLLLGGVSAITILAQPVEAQTSSAAQHPQENTSDIGAGDIVVTAQRRDQRLQDVPISISAIGASSLSNSGVTGISQLQAASPNLQVNKQNGSANLFMRGIGFSSGDLAAESSVAIYVDGVYQPTTFANVFEFNGLERIEVLKGPQGTLFGRNATGGVVQVITKDPSSTPEMNFDVGYANYETVKASAYVSGVLADNVSANVAIQYQNQNKGWGRNVTLDQKAFYARDFNLRGKLLFTPDNKTRIMVSGNYSNFDHDNIDLQNPPGSTLLTGEGYLGRYRTAGDVASTISGKSYGGSLTATHDFGGFQIRNISAYQKFSGYQVFDQDTSSLAFVKGEFFMRTRMISEEFHVMAPSSSRFQWLAGVYYFNYDTAFDPVNVTGVLFGPIGGVSVYGQGRTRSIAGFAQGTYPLTDKLNLTAGIRYSRDKVTYIGSETIVNSPIFVDPEQTKEYLKSKPTWRLSLDYKFSPDVLGYISYNRGVKSGNFALGTAPSFNEAYQPEQIDAYEAGLKTQFFDRKITFNAAAFYYNFKNIQFQKRAAGVVTTVNGPSASIYGIEADLTGRITRELTLHASGGYLHTQLGDFPGAPNTNRLSNGLDDFGDPTYNAKGNRLPYAPKYSGNVGFDYRRPVESGHVKLSSNLLYSGKAYGELDNRLFVKQYVALSASLGWEGDDGLRVSVWGNNLTNTYYYTFIGATAGASDVAIPAAPRTYGITLGYSF
ncbi:TonB-dependent receptor [Sphingomonas populi]|uniref:TonB-dependent receptor n=1 Tax=Sphingomonas populi TaxID=2484750 RepID=A0A4Q6XH12_9SPHN|nr:TonB-dependent receptor [Sphingomonas populi]RZF59191.1 TonB-dependent receptor [Sphingomonas populi]